MRKLIDSINKTKVFLKKNLDCMFTMSDEGKGEMSDKEISTLPLKSAYVRKKIDL